MKTMGLKKLIQNILTNINEETGYLFDWAMISGEHRSQIKIVDQNYALNKEIGEEIMLLLVFNLM